MCSPGLGGQSCLVGDVLLQLDPDTLLSVQPVSKINLPPDEGIPGPCAPTEQGAGADADGWWNVLYQGWTLITPAGSRINLTEAERACFLCLLHSPQRELSRDTLVSMKTSLSLRTINVAICRLRKKVLTVGEILPLHTVHGMGYVFVGNLRGQSTL